MRILFPLLAFFALTACSGLPQFARGDVTEARMRADQRACAFDADKAVASESNPLIKRSAAFDLYGRCMELKGYAPTSSTRETASN